MNDYSPRSYEMLWIICAACVFLVITAIGMSLVADGSLKFSEASNPNEERQLLIAGQKAELVRLKHEQELLQEELGRKQDLKVTHDAAVEIVSNLEDVANVLAGENGDLLLKVSETQDEIQALEDEFQKYRSEKRNVLWLRSRNRALESGDVVGGVELKNAKITSVDATGLLVRHNDGVSLIPVDQLSQELRDKLDLDPEEARLAMIELYARDAKGKEARSGVREKKETPVPTDAEISKRQTELRSAMKMKAINLFRLANESQAEAQRARMMDRSSSARSVPGSLETWAERAGRFDGLSSRYSTQLAIILSKIREFEPTFEVEKR